MSDTDFTNRAYRLRNYQRECLEAIMVRYRSVVCRQLTCLPTGSGKTVIFAEFPRYFRIFGEI
jgi:superfamily II DNA or RNA helicase